MKISFNKNSNGIMIPDGYGDFIQSDFREYVILIESEIEYHNIEKKLFNIIKQEQDIEAWIGYSSLLKIEIYYNKLVTNKQTIIILRTYNKDKFKLLDDTIKNLLKGDIS